MVSIVCEAFHCLPSAAVAELQHAPAGLIEDVLELRAYAHAKRLYDQANRAGQLNELEDSPALNTVREVLHGLLEETTADGPTR